MLGGQRIIQDASFKFRNYKAGQRIRKDKSSCNVSQDNYGKMI